jgi:PII-like signaling protein
MLSKGPAKKVTIFINEDTQHHMMALHDSIMTFLMHKGVSGATATRAYSGFGSHQMMHTPKVEVLAQHLPIRIEFVETAEKVEEILPALYEMVSDGLIEVQDTTVVKFAHKAAKPDPKLPHQHTQGPAKLLRVYLGEADKWHGQPLYDAIVDKLRMMDIAGATVYRGIMGYGAKGHEHKRSVFHPMRDMPIMLSVVDSAEKIAGAAEAIEGMLEDGLIVTSDVEMVRLLRGKTATEAPDAAGTTR